MEPAPVRSNSTRLVPGVINPYLHTKTAMGSHYALHCAACGYSNPHSCAGVESGMSVTLCTVHCAECKRLYDVPVFKHGVEVTEVPMRCPKSARHAVVAWQHPGPCPTCGATLTKLGESAIWD